MIKMVWHGHKVQYGPPHGDQNPDTHCCWTAVRSYPDHLPWPPPRPEGYICPHNHMACRSWPAASSTEIRAKLKDLLVSIGAKPGRYTLKGEINPDHPNGECILWEDVEIK